MAITGDKRDDAARAGWLYYIAGNTQEQIATKLGVSRQSAQRLVSLAVSEGLVKVRIDHPIANCMELAQQLLKRFNLDFCDIVPTDPASSSLTLGVSQSAAIEIEKWLQRKDPIIMAIGTGRTLKATIEQLPAIECPQHRVVSLTGNIAPDGSASYFNVIFPMADLVTARLFPMPLPIIATSKEERLMLSSQKMISPTLELASKADVTFVGVGELGEHGPLFVDGFISLEEMQTLEEAGAIGEIIGWAFDGKGRLIEGLTNDRVTSAPLPSRDEGLVIGIAKGKTKRSALLAALQGRLINGLITDEWTATELLEQS